MPAIGVYAVFANFFPKLALDFFLVLPFWFHHSLQCQRRSYAWP